jgi:hypothetical protein
MFDLRTFNLRDMSQLGSSLRRLGDGSENMEQVADRVVRYLYDHLCDASGVRSCALVRFFKTHAYAALDAELRNFVDATLSDEPKPGLRCLTLLATAGDEKAWNSREESVAHRAIPLVGPEILRNVPMISSLLQQLGVRLETFLSPESGLMVEADQSSFNVFYVPDAVGSKHIPAQDHFVQPVGVHSVLGFGGMLPRGDIFAVILFAKVPIPRETAEMFRTLALNVKTAVLPFDGLVFSRDCGRPE